MIVYYIGTASKVIYLEVWLLIGIFCSFQPKIESLEERMKDRESRIQDVKESMNTVEDRVFADFCASIGVENIRFCVIYEIFLLS